MHEMILKDIFQLGTERLEKEDLPAIRNAARQRAERLKLVNSEILAIVKKMQDCADYGIVQEEIEDQPVKAFRKFLTDLRRTSGRTNV